MIIGEVVGNVWATRKEESLNGLKLLIVKPIDPVSNREMTAIVAADSVGAGVGERVLVTRGSSARMTSERRDGPIDATIVGIIDEVEIY